MTLEKPAIGLPCNGCGLCCRIQVCSAGSYLLGLVQTLGDRATGPCPALVQDGDRQVCGLMRRPTHYLKARRGPTVLREAVAVLIGAGAGCDEAGDEPDDTALPKLRAIQDAYLQRHGMAGIQQAWRTLLT